MCYLMTMPIELVNTLVGWAVAWPICELIAYLAYRKGILF